MRPGPEALLVATVEAPLPGAEAPVMTYGSLIQRRGTRLVVRDPSDRRPDREFPAPWPAEFGTVTVAPSGDLAVFAGVHAAVAVDGAGVTRWELRHGCWSETVCEVGHESFTEYAGDRHHQHADRGSAAFSPDGRLLRLHVRAGDEEEWLVVDPVDGAVLGRAPTGTVGSASCHCPHPDPSRMALTVAEGEEGSPVLWGHWDGEALTVRRHPEEILLGVSPDGESYLTTDLGQGTLYLNRTSDGATLRELDSVDGSPWDFEGAVPENGFAVVGTEDGSRHWLIDLTTMTASGPITYPFPVTGTARTASPGLWYTVDRGWTAVHLWKPVRHGRVERTARRSAVHR